ncbi:hypothetical protein ACFLQU_06265, partial [Verrucomicrobiota bacterium]
QLHVHGLIQRVMTMEEPTVSIADVERREPVELDIGGIVFVWLENQDWPAPCPLQRICPPDGNPTMQPLQIVPILRQRWIMFPGLLVNAERSLSHWRRACVLNPDHRRGIVGTGYEGPF